jgi:hypothetical protein
VCVFDSAGVADGSGGYGHVIDARPYASADDCDMVIWPKPIG